MADLETEFIDLLKARGQIVKNSYSPDANDGSPEHFLALGDLLIRRLMEEIIPESVNTVIGFGEDDAEYVLSFVFNPTMMALDTHYSIIRGVEKDHGEGGVFLGDKLEKKENALVISRFFNTGLTQRQILGALPENISVRGILVGVDVSEDPKALDNFVAETQIPVWTITSNRRIQELTKN